MGKSKVNIPFLYYLTRTERNSWHIIAFPIKKRGVINIVAFCSWPEKEGTPLEGKISGEASQEEVLEQFTGWEDEAQQILQVGRPQSRSRHTD